MAKLFCLLLVLAQTACSSVAVAPAQPSPCASNEASYECQVERYNNVNVD
jgi:hypothetical protein